MTNIFRGVKKSSRARAARNETETFVRRAYIIKIQIKCVVSFSLVVARPENGKSPSGLKKNPREIFAIVSLTTALQMNYAGSRRKTSKFKVKEAERKISAAET